MKNITLSVAALLCSIATFAQVNLLHTFNGQATSVGGYIIEQLDRYTCRDDNTVRVYNPDFSLDKSISLNTPSGYTISSTALSQHTFNSDDNYEVFVISNKNDGQSYNNYCHAMIVNENGTLIKDLGHAYSMYANHSIIEGQLIFILTKMLYNGSAISYSTEIYSCGGTYTDISYNDTPTLGRPYPNPTNSIINIPYEIDHNTISEMRIFNNQGQLIEVKTLGPDFNHIQLNVEGYLPGIYLYEYNGIKEKFIVQ